MNIVGDNFRCAGIVTGLGDMEAVTRPFMPAGCIRVIGRLEGCPFTLCLDLNSGFVRGEFTLFTEKAVKQLVWFTSRKYIIFLKILISSKRYWASSSSFPLLSPDPIQTNLPVPVHTTSVSLQGDPCKLIFSEALPEMDQCV